MNHRAMRSNFGLAGLICLAACGGSGGGSLASAPVPPVPAPSPTPSPTSTPPGASAGVMIFSNPQPAEFVTAGASISAPGGNLDTYQTSTERFGSVSTDAADQPLIRYSSSGFYEVRLPRAAWDRLVPYKGLLDPGPQNNYFQPQSVAQNRGFVATLPSDPLQYTYSRVASWGSQADGRQGWFAFGLPTPTGQVPLTGSATFNGFAQGSSDILEADNLYGGFVPTPVDGAVTLDFDFAGGVLNGSMTLALPDGMQPAYIGTFNFKETVFSRGSTTYSGRFDTPVAGQNFFLGRFTGPGAEETIGAWAIPFLFDKGGDIVKPDGQVHQAFGAWMARKQ
jgi:hypothetical protein